VTLIEMVDQILPLEDADTAAEVAKVLRQERSQVLTSTRTEKVVSGEKASV
jgi:pyruvate/2-oxoglutarate dehydrogenase complex dihydrolipoamide dehydrogenase (E3) component